MPDREKVIEALEVTREFLGYGLPGTAEIFAAYTGAISDAIALLKEPEPLKPEAYMVANEYTFYRCPACKIGWHYKYDYCPKCGRAVKWDA